MPLHHSNGTFDHCHSSNDTNNLPDSVRRIADAWSCLSPNIREAILTLVDAGRITIGRHNHREIETARDDRRDDRLTWRLARECRSIIQGCLREEEWRNADLAFFDVIQAGLASRQP
ncbi:hypothetical protein K2Y11_09760 [bacterium]|nr:hypothetical protein [bacterium]